MPIDGAVTPLYANARLHLFTLNKMTKSKYQLIWDQIDGNLILRSTGIPFQSSNSLVMLDNGTRNDVGMAPKTGFQLLPWRPRSD